MVVWVSFLFSFFLVVVLILFLFMFSSSSCYCSHLVLVVVLILFSWLCVSYVTQDMSLELKNNVLSVVFLQFWS